jgi:hypothetical protein
MSYNSLTLSQRAVILVLLETFPTKKELVEKEELCSERDLREDC